MQLYRTDILTFLTDDVQPNLEVGRLRTVDVVPCASTSRLEKTFEFECKKCAVFVLSRTSLCLGLKFQHSKEARSPPSHGLS